MPLQHNHRFLQCKNIVQKISSIFQLGWKSTTAKLLTLAPLDYTPGIKLNTSGLASVTIFKMMGNPLSHLGVITFLNLEVDLAICVRDDLTLHQQPTKILQRTFEDF